MVDLGYNYRLSDLQCALGQSQLRKLPAWLAAFAPLLFQDKASVSRQGKSSAGPMAAVAH